MSDVGAFLDAVKRGDLGAVEQQLADHALAGAATPEGVSAIMLALYHGHPAVATAIATRRPRLTLLEAVGLGDLERVRTLAGEDGTKVHAWSADGFSPLGLAAFFGRHAIAELLLDYGADPNAASRNAMQVTPLHSAVANRMPNVALELARLLLSRGANPNVQQHGGWTPLHAAAMHGHRELVALLLAFGADPSPVSEDRKSPSQMAAEAGHHGVVDLLERAPRVPPPAT